MQVYASFKIDNNQFETCISPQYLIISNAERD